VPCYSYNTNKFGFRKIIDHLERKIPVSKVHYGHRVAKIDYSGAKTRITLTTGQTLEQDYEFVIVTTALGHLKKFARKMFKPKLPAKKLEAIDKIGMGTSQKIFFEYTEPFWQNKPIIPLPVAGCGARKELGAIESEFTSFQLVSWAPNLLMAWVAGHGPEKVDHLSDVELAEIVTRLFRDVYRNESLPFPKQILRKKWAQDDLFGGTYSYVSLAQARARIHHSDMSIPVKRNGRVRIQFAGEATHHRIFQTAVGAFLSGRREADRVLDAAKEWKN